MIYGGSHRGATHTFTQCDIYAYPSSNTIRVRWWEVYEKHLLTTQYTFIDLAAAAAHLRQTAPRRRDHLVSRARHRGVPAALPGGARQNQTAVPASSGETTEDFASSMSSLIVEGRDYVLGPPTFAYLPVPLPASAASELAALLHRPRVARRLQPGVGLRARAPGSGPSLHAHARSRRAQLDVARWSGRRSQHRSPPALPAHRARIQLGQAAAELQRDGRLPAADRLGAVRVRVGVGPALLGLLLLQRPLRAGNIGLLGCASSMK